MTTISMKTDLDVISKYTCLMQSSLSSESIYIRTKETLEALFQDSALTNEDKANVLSQVLGSLSGTLSSAAMQTALQWAIGEKDLFLKKLEAEKQLGILDAEKELKDAQADKTYYESIAVQANTKRMYGTPTVIDGVLTALADEGKIWWDIKVAEKQEINLGKEGNLLDSRLQESYAVIHKTVADTVVNYGSWTYVLAQNGITTTPVRNAITTNVKPLSDIQRTIAEQQAKGYAYNAWANAATGAAGMIGTAIASDGAITEVSHLIPIIETTLNNLKDATAPV